VPAVTTYCAPCLADLALVREATTAVSGTASCMAHAVLLRHPGDDPQRRRQRLAQLRDTATDKLDSVGPDERVRLEILVEEYSLASAMESLVPRRRPDGLRPGDRPGGDRPGQPGQQGDGPLSRSARKRRGRDRERVPGAGATVADGSAERAGAEALEQVGAPSGEPPAASDVPAVPATDAPTPATETALPAAGVDPGPSGEAPLPGSAPAEAAGGLAGDAPAPSPAAPAEHAPAPAEAAGGLASGPDDVRPPAATVTPGPVSPVGPPADAPSTDAPAGPPATD
jgi:hypothetical protein